MQPAPRLEPPPAVAPPSQSAFPVATSRGRLLLDRFAVVLVRAGGFAVVFSLIGILAFLVVEVAPLFRGANVSEPRALGATGSEPAVLLADASLARVASVAHDGSVSVLDASSGAIQATFPFPLAGEVVAVGEAPGESTVGPRSGAAPRARSSPGWPGSSVPSAARGRQGRPGSRAGDGSCTGRHWLGDPRTLGCAR